MRATFRRLVDGTSGALNRGGIEATVEKCRSIRLAAEFVVAPMRRNEFGRLAQDDSSFSFVKRGGDASILWQALPCLFADSEPVSGSGLAPLTLRDRHVLHRVFGAGVFGSWADEAVVVELFDDVGSPSGDAAGSEDGREEVEIDAQRGVG